MSALAHTRPSGYAAEPASVDSRAARGESLLSRDEIDAVLGRVGGFSCGGENTGPPPGFGPENAPEAKDEILRRFAHLLESSLQGLGLDPVTVRLDCALIGARADPTLHGARSASALFHIPGMNVRGVVYVHARLADALVRRFFARTRSRDERTLAERVLVQRMLDIAVGALRRALQPRLAMDLVPERIEAKRRWAPSEAGLGAFTTRFWVGLEAGGGVLDLTLPAVLLGAAQARFAV